MISSPAHPSRAAVIAALAASALLLSEASVCAQEAEITAPSAISPNAASILTVPEPGVLVSLAGGVGVLLGLQRFRRRG